MESVLLDFDTWEKIEREEVDQVGPYTLGIDLGTSAAMSAAAAYWPENGAADCFAVFPRFPDLLERGRADGVDSLYVQCYERGDLLIEGERVSDISALLLEARARWGLPAAIVCDRWREQELREKLEVVKFPVVDLWQFEVWATWTAGRMYGNFPAVLHG